MFFKPLMQSSLNFKQQQQPKKQHFGVLLLLTYSEAMFGNMSNVIKAAICQIFALFQVPGLGNVIQHLMLRELLWAARLWVTG